MNEAVHDAASGSLRHVTPHEATTTTGAPADDAVVDGAGVDGAAFDGAGVDGAVLDPPAQPLPVVRRHHLLSQLDCEEKLVVIHAGRFDGASTLLRSFLDTRHASAPGVVAHVIEPAPDISGDQYWGRLDAMLSRRPLAGTADAGNGHTDATSTGGPPRAFAALLDTVADQTRPVLLVLDDLHLIDDAMSRVEDLLAVSPTAGLRVIAVTRIDGVWSHWIDRHSDQRFLSSDSLRVEPGDVATVLRLSGVEYDVRTPEIIHRVTDGLPALVQAACRAVPAAELAEPEHLEEFVNAAIDREVDQTLRQDPQLSEHRGALLLSAAANPLTADNAALFGSCSGVAALLAAVDRSGMARISGAPSAPERRYPRPVRSALLRLAAREDPGLLDRARRELISLWVRMNRPNDALLAAEEIRDWPRVVEILRTHFETLYTRDYPTTMGDEVLARVPDEFVADDPLLRRLRSMHHRFAAPRNTPGPAPVATTADTRAGSGDLRADRFDALFQAVELRINGRFADSAALCEPFARAPLPNLGELSKEDRDTQGFAFVHIGISYLLTGRFDEAIAALRRAFHTAVEPFIHRDAAGKLALINVLLGDLDEARAWLAEERRHPSLPTDTEALVRPAGDIAAALLALEDLDSAKAMDILHELHRPSDREEFWGFILYAWGQLSLVNGTPANGLRFLEKEMLRFTSMRGHGTVVRPLLDAVRAEIHLACDRPGQAQALVADSPHPLTAPVRARLLLLDDDPTAALAVARPALSDHHISPRDAMDLELIAAAAALATGGHEQARRHLLGATTAYRMTGIRRPFASLPGPILRRLAALGPVLPVDPEAFSAGFGRLTFVDDAGTPASTGNDDDEARAAAHHALTEREIQVLRALASGATNREIAAEEFVSVNTVKSQLRSVYRKLAVASRQDAVAVARLLEIL